jgi:hypothetical protein
MNMNGMEWKEMNDEWTCHVYEGMRYLNTEASGWINEWLPIAEGETRRPTAKVSVKDAPNESSAATSNPKSAILPIRCNITAAITK